jgi:hypothetical protein
VPQPLGGCVREARRVKPLYIRGHIDGKLISRILVDGGAAVNLMSYAVFKKLGWENNELMKTNLTLNSVGGGGQPNGVQRCHLHGAHRGEQIARYCVCRRRGAR